MKRNNLIPVVIALCCMPALHAFSQETTDVESLTASKTAIGTNQKPFAIKLADIDGDGKPDLLVANMGAGSISVYRNISENGTVSKHSFAEKVDFSTGRMPVALCIGDIDGDGKPDIVVTNYFDGTISILRNTSSKGNISVAPQLTLATGNNPYSVALSDLDGDGKPDIAVANLNSNTISLFRNNAKQGSITAASLAKKVDMATGLNPAYMVIKDIDGDKKPELLVANAGGNSVSIFHNLGRADGPTAISFAQAIDLKSGNGPVSIAVSEGNNMVIAVANKLSSTVSLFTYQNKPNFSAASFSVTTIQTGKAPMSVALRDINNDRLADLLVADYKQPQQHETGILKTIYHFAGYNSSSQLYENNQSNSKSVLSVYVANSDNASTMFTARADIETGNNPVAIETGDITGGGALNVLVSNFNDNTISIFSRKLKPAAITTATIIPAFNVGIYPNPNNGIVNLDASGSANQKLTAVFYNPMGKEIYRISGISRLQQTVDLHAPKASFGRVYIVKVYGGASVVTKKILVAGE